jgi:hypothetical protein
LVGNTALTQLQANDMRTAGYGWGNVMIATRLAERIAADNPDTTLTDQQKFDTALKQVMDARAAGKGFGEIADEYDTKVGRSADNAGVADTTKQPPFITRLVDNTALTPEQAAQMRSSGMGWGNVMIATRLAERIAADNTDATLTDQEKFDAALKQVMDGRAAGKGFGEIANENDLKVGRLVGSSNKNLNGESVKSEKARNKNIFSRLFSALGFGKSKERTEKLSMAEKPDHPQKPEKLEKPERVERPDTLSKPEKPERPGNSENAGGHNK